MNKLCNISAYCNRTLRKRALRITNQNMKSMTGTILLQGERSKGEPGKDEPE